MKVLALDVSTSTTGFAVVDSNLKLLEYGQFTIKDRTLSDTMYTVEITDKSLALAEKYKVDGIIIEDIYFSKQPQLFRRWARVHGGMALTWYKKTKKEPVFIMAISARPKAGINGKATKIEVQLEIAKRYNLVKTATYTEYLSKFNDALKEKKANKLTKNQFDYRVKKLSEDFESSTSISEHIADSVVLGLAFFK
jgi:crossover junction endodeoxyribonuclease RuvC